METPFSDLVSMNVPDVTVIKNYLSDGSPIQVHQSIRRSNPVHISFLQVFIDRRCRCGRPNKWVQKKLAQIVVTMGELPNHIINEDNCTRVYRRKSCNQSTSKHR